MAAVDASTDEIVARIRDAGVAGAGGAGFPSYAKWEHLDDVDHLLMNHEESEPNYYSDKWLAREHPDVFADLFEVLLEDAVDAVVVGAKEKYRDEGWMGPLESATDGAVFGSDDLPVAIDDESGVVFAYTDDVYDFSEEQVLLMIAVGERIGRDLPTDHGWLVHNTESLYNVARALTDGTPVTRKFVHVDGDTPRHRCLDVPIGTTATDLLGAADLDADAMDGAVLADGGPGWCYEIDEPPAEFGVRKRTNAVLVLGREEVDEHTELEDRVNVLEARDWHDREHETEPAVLEPDHVRIPLITNAAYEGLVGPSVPCVTAGDSVSVGDVVAEPAADAISIPQHASIDGTVAEVTETHVVVER